MLVHVPTMLPLDSFGPVRRAISSTRHAALARLRELDSHSPEAEDDDIGLAAEV